jgi:hypothetical protein
MKYSIATLLLLGVISTSEAFEQDTSLVQLNSKQQAFESDSESDDEAQLLQTGWTGAFGPGDEGLIDALTPAKGDCAERLWNDPRELAW